MTHYIDKYAVVTKIKKLQAIWDGMDSDYCKGQRLAYSDILSFLNTLEVKEVGLIIHTVIAECCDWLAMNTNLSHDEIEGCRNLMLTVKEEQLKVQKGV